MQTDRQTDRQNHRRADWE